MSSFSCPVVKILSVESHPGADRLSIVKVLGYTCISGKLQDGSHRYKAGDWVVYIPSASVLPEWLLKEMDFWNEEKNMGGLSGSSGDRVKPLRLRSIYSEGVLYPVDIGASGEGNNFSGSFTISIPNNATRENGDLVFDNGREDVPVDLGDDVSGLLGIEKYSPPIPAHLAGEVANMFGHTAKYDFERIESVPDMFELGEGVTFTEKLHGTFCGVSYIPGLNHPEMFGPNGDFLVHSKGLGAQGLAFKNVPNNASNMYVRVLQKLIDDGLETTLKDVIPHIKTVRIFGEIFGQGVQDLHYGLSKPEFRVFDIQINDEWQSSMTVDTIAKMIGAEMVPMLYIGPYDPEVLISHRDGKTILGNGANVREGGVIRSSPEGVHPHHGRKIAKMISPDYLLRKSKNATEYT